MCCGELSLSEDGPPHSDNICILSQVAVAQYATDYHAVFNFENFAVAKNPLDLMNGVTHEKGNTHTAAAIRYVL